MNLPSEKDVSGHNDALELCESELTLLENDPDDHHAQSIARYRTRLENWREALLGTAPVREVQGRPESDPPWRELIGSLPLRNARTLLRIRKNESSVTYLCAAGLHSKRPNRI